MSRAGLRALFSVALAVALTAPASIGRAEVELLDGGESGRIVNGTPTDDFAAVGVVLAGSSPSSASMVCTGTLIGCRTFLTAAHCVCVGSGQDCQPPNQPDADDFLVFLPHVGFLPVSNVFVHPDFRFLSRFSQADLAIVELAVPVTGIQPLPIADAPTPIGTDATIVGFGRSGGGSKNTDYGIKRVGVVGTDPCNTTTPDGLICWNFLGPGSNTCNGDSGGPLFADLGSGDVLAGVTSGGASASCLPNDHSFDTDVGYYSDWVVATATEPLGAPSCGAGSHIGDPDNLDEGSLGSLAGCRVSSSHEFVVPVGSGQLRIAMNGKDDGATDFNLLVRRGAPPVDAPGGFDCKQAGPGQFGFCQFANPGGGRWFVRVERASGGGEYQLTVNERNTQPSVCGNSLLEPGEACDGTDDPACVGLCQPDCTCPAPQCGNAVTEAGEDCDAGSDDLCPGLCSGGCTCECIDDDMNVRRVVANTNRLLARVEIDSTGGEYANFNPSNGFRFVLDDGSDDVTIDLPPGDVGWAPSDCAKRRFKWKGNKNGVTLVRVTDRTEQKGIVQIKVRGKKVPGADSLVIPPLTLEAKLDRACAKGFLLP